LKQKVTLLGLARKLRTGCQCMNSFGCPVPPVSNLRPSFGVYMGKHSREAAWECWCHNGVKVELNHPEWGNPITKEHIWCTLTDKWILGQKLRIPKIQFAKHMNSKRRKTKVWILRSILLK
jgi:hypothetical protein